MEFIFDEEKYFKKIDELCTIVKPLHFDEIHIATRDDKYLLVFPKNKQLPCYKDKHIVSPQEAIKLVEKDLYEFRYATGFGNRESIQAVWMMKDVIGKPYLKHWIELVNVFQDTTEPLIYDGPNIDLPHKNRMVNQIWCYKMTNAILGLENHDDILETFYKKMGRLDWQKAAKEDKIRWTTTINE